ATDKVRLVGDLVALVVAQSRYVAEDACDLIAVDYEPLPPVLDADTALAPTTPPLFEDIGTNLLYQIATEYGDVAGAFAEADVVVRETFRQDRHANVPMETRGAVASYDPGTDELTFHASCQAPHMVRYHLSSLVGHPMAKLHVVNGDVGGSFGLKVNVHREDVALAAASKRLGRPVKWIEDRNEHLVASGQGRAEEVEVEAAVKNDGTVLGIKARLTIDHGAYPCFPFPVPAMTVGWVNNLLPGPYHLKSYAFDGRIVATNKCTWVAYRGPWEVETWVRERVMDVLARAVGITPAEIRRRNMVLGEE